MSNNLLKGKKGIIFGALDENSIAWKTALKVNEQGGEFILTNAPVAMRMGTISVLAKQTNSLVIPADATRVEDLENLIEKTLNHFNNKIDFVHYTWTRTRMMMMDYHHTSELWIYMKCPPCYKQMLPW